MPAVSISLAATASGSSDGHRVRQLADRGAVGLHADRVDHRVRPAAVGHVADRVGQVVVVLAEVDRLDAAPARALEPLGDQVDADHAPRPAVPARRGTHMSPIGPSPSTTSVPPGGTAAYSTACHAVGRTSER